MDITDKITDIISLLEDAVSYEDWKSVEEAIKELNFVNEELQSDFPFDDLEDDF
jgi:hypothetical protein